MTMFMTILLAVSFLGHTHADVNVTDYIYWKKQDIYAWHQFFPCRYLEQEQLTVQAAMQAVQAVSAGLNDSLSSVVAFQVQELSTAELLMQDTEAEGCVNGIANYMTNAIGDAIDTYLDCTADALAKLARLNSTWAKTRSTYMSAYAKALKGIDACFYTYPNKDSISRLMSCVESMNSRYFAAANATQAAMFPSPSMTYFQQTVVGCASSAALNVTSKAWKFLEMLVECSQLTTTMDSKAYAEQLMKWPGYNDTLLSQINISLWKNYYQVWAVEQEMEKYYNLQKTALETYVIESREYGYYVNKTYMVLEDYYNTVTATALDNPGDPGCTNTAKAALDTVASNGASNSLACDKTIVNSTRTLMGNVKEIFFDLNQLLPDIGPVAVLDCFSQGYIFAPSTILDCYHLVYSSFAVEHSDRRVDIESDVTVLLDYVIVFFNSTDLPCGGSSLRRLLLGGDIALYNLQRCLYTVSGTTYDVTTPNSNSSTGWTTTTVSPAFMSSPFGYHTS